jgi:hypothetical protein
MIGQYYKGNNFWETFPEFRILDIFDKLYREDKTKKNEYSSNIMWGVTFCLRKESPMYNLPDKWFLAAKDIIGSDKFNWDDYQHIIDAFKSSHMTQAERSLYAWEELMTKRDKYLKNREYYFDEYLLDDKEK